MGLLNVYGLGFKAFFATVRGTVMEVLIMRTIIFVV